ncbi:hypothetical protein JOQ06_022044 [Pogonophryne albipinna]|uniref:Uncharacterized protein n=1 Tax=Pogonophryne albipinna TaxID=1090488 RepID=A0AAD6ABT3_9TELE|nr:hypothetical protein JOQ06_022044 [Pogonophryne albipinna]
MWQLCSSIPSTLPDPKAVSLMTAKLSTSCPRDFHPLEGEGNALSPNGKDEVYDRMLLDYFLSYHQFSHLLCRVAINCEKFTETLVKLSVLIAYEGLPLHLAIFPKLWTELCQSQSALAKTCVKLLCEDPAFSEYIKCILMDERTFLNNNVAYSFLTCFLHKVQVLSGPSCSNLISVLVTNLLSEQSSLQPELIAHRLELSKTSGLLNADLRALVLLLSEAGEEPERHNDDEEEGRRCEGQSEEGQEEKEAGSKTSLAPPLPEDNAAAFPSSLGLVGEGPEGCIGPAPSSSSSSSSSSPQAFPGASSPPDMLDMLYRTVEATIAIVTKLSVKGPPTS